MLGVDDKCVDAGVANHHDEFSTRRPEVEGYEYCAETRDGEHRGQERRLVQAEERRACAALDPEFPQVSRHGANATLHLGVGPALIALGQRNGGAEFSRRPVEQVWHGDRRDGFELCRNAARILRDPGKLAIGVGFIQHTDLSPKQQRCLKGALAGAPVPIAIRESQAARSNPPLTARSRKSGGGRKRLP